MINNLWKIRAGRCKTWEWAGQCSKCLRYHQRCSLLQCHHRLWQIQNLIWITNQDYNLMLQCRWNQLAIQLNSPLENKSKSRRNSTKTKMNCKRNKKKMTRTLQINVQTLLSQMSKSRKKLKKRLRWIQSMTRVLKTSKRLLHKN